MLSTQYPSVKQVSYYVVDHAWVAKAYYNSINSGDIQLADSSVKASYEPVWRQASRPRPQSWQAESWLPVFHIVGRRFAA